MLLNMGGGGVTNSFAQKFTPKYLRENDKSLLALTSRATDDGWLEFRSDAEPVAAVSFSTRFAKTLGLQDGYQLKLMNDKTDPKETRHQHYQLYWKNALVEGGHLSLHSRKGVLTAAHSRIIDGLDVATDKAIAERTALAAALTDQKVALANVEEKLLKSQLVLTSMDGNYTKESYRLAYYFDVYSSKKTVLEATRVYVDATSGTVLKRYPLVNNCFAHDHVAKDLKHSESKVHELSGNEVAAPLVAATFNNLYPRGNPTPTFEVENTGQGSQTRLTMSTNNVSQALQTFWDFNNNGAFDDPIPTNPNLNWGNNLQAATLAHWTTWRSYEYFRNRFGIDGTNGQGDICRILISPPLVEIAGWSSEQRIMVLGSSPTTGRTLSTVDIVAHEFGHGMSGYLVGGWDDGNGQPASLNEGFSDIIGATMERQLLPEGAPNDPRYWQVGEDSWYIRDMANPHLFQQPQTYLEPGFWNNNPPGPHWNNGVLNKWFHTLNTGNGPNGNSITPISSIDDAMSVIYWALDFYIYGDYNYPNAANALRLAAGAVFGECSPQQIAVADAFGVVNLPVGTCSPDCNYRIAVTFPTNLNCNQGFTLFGGCEGAPTNSSIYACQNNSFSFAGPNVPFNAGPNALINLTAPSTPGNYQYSLTLSRPNTSCYVRTQTFNINVNCTQPPLCDFSSGPRYVGTWSNLTVQIRQISGKNVLVTAVVGSSSDKYYPRGDNFWNQVNIDPNAANLQGCLNAGSTDFGGLVIPGGLNPPSGYVQGQEQDGAIFYYLGGNPPPPNICDFSVPRTVGTWNGLTVQIRQYPNNKKVLVTAVNGASNDKHYPRGDNFWDNFTKNADAEQYRTCLNGGTTEWYGLAIPGGVSPNGGYQQGQEQDGSIFFSTNGLRKAAPEGEPTIESVALVTFRPNPVQETVTVRYALTKAATVPVRVLDLQGRMMQTHSLVGVAGQNEQTLDVSSLATGLYAVEVLLNQERIIHKMVKQ